MNPKQLDYKTRFALRTKAQGKYITPHSVNLSDDPREARLFSGEYLNATVWDWHLHNTLVAESELDGLIKAMKK